MEAGTSNAQHAATHLLFSTMSDAEVKEALQTFHIGLTIEEARTISSLLKRDPTLVEAVIWGIQGSEHCSYKSSKRFLKTLPTENRHVILGPKEDSGIVAITDAPVGKRWGLVISHESHNHPSQIVPFEGAATGVGGTVRDVACMGARVIGCMDMLRLGDLKTPESRTIAKEVVSGIAGYGNPLGLPNLGGDTVFDTSYNTNCLVNAIAVGLVREDEIIHSTVPAEAGDLGYDIVIIGKPTDRSGFGGAAFASLAMEKEKHEQNTGAVQEPNPFLERHLLASTYALFDWLATSRNLGRVSFKDLGAGGVVCATVEQVADRGYGADIELTDVHVAILNLPPEIIACAETQERLCWMCHPDLTAHILRHYNEMWDLPSVAEGAQASVIGKVTADGVYRLRFHGSLVCEARAQDITCGLQYSRPTSPVVSAHQEPAITCEGDRISALRKTLSLRDVFLAMLAHPNHASKEPVIRHYDKDVLGNTLIEPGEADASVTMPLLDLWSYVQDGTHPGWESAGIEEQWQGVALAAGGKGRYGRIAPYWQGANAAVETMCNVAAVGAVPRALTDCLNYGNPEIPTHLWALEEGVRGIADAARGVAIDGEPVAVISGNVSLYNSTPHGTAIDPTAIVCCIGVLPDARKAVTMQLKQSDSILLLLGERRDECGGSAYTEVLEGMLGSPRDSLLGANVPKPAFDFVRRSITLLSKAAANGLLRSSHDISDGGLLLAAFEMTLPQRKIGGTIGVDVDLDAQKSALRTDTILFSETPGFILEVDTTHIGELNTLAKQQSVSLLPLGRTTANPRLSISRNGSIVLESPLDQPTAIWARGLERAWARA